MRDIETDFLKFGHISIEVYVAMNYRSKVSFFQLPNTFIAKK